MNKLARNIAFIALGLSISSFAFGIYLDTRCEGIGCFLTAMKEGSKKAKGTDSDNDFNIHIDIDDDDDVGGGDVHIDGQDLVLPAMEKLEGLEIEGVNTEITIKEGPALKARANGFTNNSKWVVRAEGKMLRINVKEKGPDSLDVELPKVVLDHLSITSVSGEIRLHPNVSTKVLILTSVSADIDIATRPVSDLTIKTVSGDVRIGDLGEGPTIARFQTVSGDVRFSAPKDFQSIRAKSVSGDMTLKLPPNTGFSYEMKSMSGDFRGIPGAKVSEAIGNKSTSGRTGEDRAANLEYESVSGDFKLEM